MLELTIVFGVIGTLGTLINLTFTAISRAKALAAFIKASTRTTLETFLGLLRTIESTYCTTLANLSSLPGRHHGHLSDLFRTLSKCLRACRLHSSEIDDHLVRILQSRCRAWTAKWAGPHLEMHRNGLEAAKMDLHLCMSTIR